MTYGTASKIEILMLDKKGQKTRTQLYVPPIENDGSNITDVFGSLGNADLLTTAFDVLTGCAIKKVTTNLLLNAVNEAKPTDDLHVRELALRFTYQDTVTLKYYRFDLPGPVDGLVSSAGDEVGLDNVAIAAFKLVFDANARSEFGNAVVLTACRSVGRNS